jgi:hypothetical protein
MVPTQKAFTARNTALPRTKLTSKPQLTARQRRNELIAIISIAAASMPLAIAIPSDPAHPSHIKKTSKSGQTCLDVSTEMPLSVTTD